MMRSPTPSSFGRRGGTCKTECANETRESKYAAGDWCKFCDSQPDRHQNDYQRIGLQSPSAASLDTAVRPVLFDLFGNLWPAFYLAHDQSAAKEALDRAKAGIRATCTFAPGAVLRVDQGAEQVFAWPVRSFARALPASARTAAPPRK